MFDCSQHQIHQRFLSLTTTPVVTMGGKKQQKKKEQNFSAKARKVLVNMLGEEEKLQRSFTSNARRHRFKAKEASGMSARVLNKTLMNKVVGRFNVHIHTLILKHTNYPVI